MTVDPLIMRQASWQAGTLVASAGFAPHDWQDIRQELILDCLRRSHRFDPARGEWTGFVRGVVRNHAAVLIMRARRRTPEVLCDDLMISEDASNGGALALLDKRPSSGVVDELHLSLDVRRVVASLPAHLQSLAVLLSQMPVRDVCMHTGKSRSRVYQMTRQIRDAFLEAGFSPVRPRCSTRREVHS